MPIRELIGIKKYPLVIFHPVDIFYRHIAATISKELQQLFNF